MGAYRRSKNRSSGGFLFCKLTAAASVLGDGNDRNTSTCDVAGAGQSAVPAVCSSSGESTPLAQAGTGARPRSPAALSAGEYSRRVHQWFSPLRLGKRAGRAHGRRCRCPFCCFALPPPPRPATPPVSPWVGSRGLANSPPLPPRATPGGEFVIPSLADRSLTLNQGQLDVRSAVPLGDIR